MANRLNQIQTHLESRKANRIIHYRENFPLPRNELRNHIYGEKYRKIVDQCFDVIAENKQIFQHGDIEDYTRSQEREQGAKMAINYHKLRPVNTLNIESDPHAVSLSAHATYNFDPGFCVRTDITIFLYTKTILSCGRPESLVHK